MKLADDAVVMSKRKRTTTTKTVLFWVGAAVAAVAMMSLRPGLALAPNGSCRIGSSIMRTRTTAAAARTASSSIKTPTMRRRTSTTTGGSFRRAPQLQLQLQAAGRTSGGVARKNSDEDELWREDDNNNNDQQQQQQQQRQKEEFSRDDVAVSSSSTANTTFIAAYDHHDITRRRRRQRRRLAATIQATSSRRRAIGVIGIGLMTGLISSSLDDHHADSNNYIAHAALVWHKDPVNKRSGVQVIDAERAGYNTAFCTYLTRFLLTFDRPTQQYWFQQLSSSSSSPSSSTSTTTTTTAALVFAKLAASVEIGLQSYTDATGPARLLRNLLARYGPPPPPPAATDVVPKVVDPLQQQQTTTQTTKTITTTTTSTTTTQRRQRREAKEAQRQLALLFALLNNDRQPVAELSMLLAAIDNGRIVDITLLQPPPPLLLMGEYVSNNNDATTMTTTTTTPNQSDSSSSSYYAIIPPPPANTAVGGDRARAQPIFGRTGRIVLQVVDGGSGYSAQQPPTSVQIGTVTLPSKVTVNKGGRVTEVELIIKDDDDENMAKIAVDQCLMKGADVHSVTVVRPTTASSSAKGAAFMTDAMIRAVPELALTRIDVTYPGSGYLVEKPVRVYLTTDPSLLNATADEIKTLYNNNDKNENNSKLQLVGKAIPQAERSSYTSYLRSSGGGGGGSSTMMIDDDFDDDENSSTPVAPGVKASATGPDSGLPPLPFWTEKSSASDLLRLLPAGIGLEYDRSLQRYVLAVDPAYQKAYPIAADVLRGGNSGRPLGPEFGPRGRAPIEKNMEYTTDVLLRFALSGAICSSAVHVALTPLDVVKTKVQTNPERYPTVPISFGRIYRDEGLSTFYSGWLPTLLGNFIAGGALYLLTEVIRKYLTEAVIAATAAGSTGVAATYEVPIILAAAATASAVGAMIICPFEAVRIRGVAQPDYGTDSVAVLQRMIREDGVVALINTIPVFLVKNVPYAMTKFTIFDLSTERLFAAFPAAQEELRWSLLISLLGGILGGTAAAVVSNPADALISELKKSQKRKTTTTTTSTTGNGPDAGGGDGPVDVARDMWRRGDNGPRLFFKGLALRMVFAPLVASLQFCLYDFVRFSLGIGPDDLKLYLDVLGGALAGISGSAGDGLLR